MSAVRSLQEIENDLNEYMSGAKDASGISLDDLYAAVIKANLVREWLMAELRQSADRWMKAEGASYPEAQADASARNDCGNAIDDLLIECAEREATP